MKNTSSSTFLEKGSSQTLHFHNASCFATPTTFLKQLAPVILFARLNPRNASPVSLPCDEHSLAALCSWSLHPPGQGATRRLIIYQEPGHAKGSCTPDLGYRAAIQLFSRISATIVNVVISRKDLIRLAHSRGSGEYSYSPNTVSHDVL